MKMYVFTLISIKLLVLLQAIANNSSSWTTSNFQKNMLLEVTSSENHAIYKPDSIFENMVKVEGGRFKMGSNEFGDEQPIHEVELSTYFISKYEVSIGDYMPFCQEENNHWPEWLIENHPLNIKSNPNSIYAKQGINPEAKTKPISGITWYDADAFCKWLSKKSGRTYRLPTEAEWEFAARGGNDSKGFRFSGSSKIDTAAWFAGNSKGIAVIGTRKSNELGLFDMSGNVWEWCSDWYDATYYQHSTRKNPKGPSTGDFRVCRGGSANNTEHGCRNTNRNFYPEDYRFALIGFRMVCEDN